MAAYYIMWEALLLEERAATLSRRIDRRRLRDSQNPFELPSTEFVAHFRLSKELAVEVIDICRPTLGRRNASGLAPELQVLAALNFYATGSYQRSSGALLPISQPTVSRCLHAVTEAINNNLMPMMIKFPMTPLERREAKETYIQKPNPFPGAIGAIDCTHVRIIAPSEHEEAYVDHHGNHSLNVQAICDPNLRVMDICARWPGSRHDSFIWGQSGARAAMVYWYQHGERGTFLLGDSGYPLEPWLETVENDTTHGYS